MLLVVIHNVGSGNKSRVVTSCFAGQVMIDVPEVLFSASSVNGFVYISRATVVSSNCQVPFTENAIQVFQVLCRSTGGFNRIAAFVYERIDGKPINFSRTMHKLPDTCSSCP